MAQQAGHAQPQARPEEVTKKEATTAVSPSESARVKHARYSYHAPSTHTTSPAGPFASQLIEQAPVDVGSPIVMMAAAAENSPSGKTIPHNSLKRKAEDTTEAQLKQDKVRERNREQARRCRSKKKQESEEMDRRIRRLEHENSVLKKAFRALYNQKSLMEALVVSQCGNKGAMIVDRTRRLDVAEKCSLSQLCSDLLGTPMSSLPIVAAATAVADPTENVIPKVML
jgi:hypothetical protein